MDSITQSCCCCLVILLTLVYCAQNTMATQTVILIRKHGGPEVMEVVKDYPMPQRAQGEVLVKIVSTCVNPVDYKVRSGAYPVEELPKVRQALIDPKRPCPWPTLPRLCPSCGLCSYQTHVPHRSLVAMWLASSLRPMRAAR
jgi:hypothetical protein